MEDMSTGDFHADRSAPDLLCALIDNHIYRARAPASTAAASPGGARST